jgi:hypothetical protein
MSSPYSAQPRILRIPRSDDTGYVLMHVSRYGPAVLDLKLVATEGENPYAGVGMFLVARAVVHCSEATITH